MSPLKLKLCPLPPMSPLRKRMFRPQNLEWDIATHSNVPMHVEIILSSTVCVQMTHQVCAQCVYRWPMEPQVKRVHRWPWEPQITRQVHVQCTDDRRSNPSWCISCFSLCSCTGLVFPLSHQFLRMHQSVVLHSSQVSRGLKRNFAWETWTYLHL